MVIRHRHVKHHEEGVVVQPRGRARGCGGGNPAAQRLRAAQTLQTGTASLEANIDVTAVLPGA